MGCSRVFEETFDVVHGDEGGGWGDGDDGLVVACSAMDLFRILCLRASHFGSVNG